MNKTLLFLSLLSIPFVNAMDNRSTLFCTHDDGENRISVTHISHENIRTELVKIIGIEGAFNAYRIQSLSGVDISTEELFSSEYNAELLEWLKEKLIAFEKKIKVDNN